MVLFSKTSDTILHPNYKISKSVLDFKKVLLNVNYYLKFSKLSAYIQK